jgi:hypothetical protein
MAKIFVCYRREDAATEAGRITDWLDRHFGEDEVFMDINTIGLGDDFVEKIEGEIDTIDALIAVIGPSWLEAKDENGNRRLDDPTDFVRLEIAQALRRGIRVIPVLVEGAAMPPKPALPEEIQSLARRNGLVLTNLQFKAGIRALIQALEDIVTSHVPTPPPSESLVQEQKVEPEPGAAQPHAALPALGVEARLAGFAASALVLSGIVYNNAADIPERFVHPRFGGPSSFVGDSHVLWWLAGLWQSLPTIGIVVIAVWGLQLLRRSGEDAVFGAGLVLAAGLQGVALYGAWLLTSDGRTVAFVVPLLGALVLTAIGVWLATSILRPPRTRHQQPSAPVRVAAASGAVASLVAMFVHFNGGGTQGVNVASVMSGHHFQRWDLFLIGLSALAIALVPVPGPPALAVGVLIACGIGGATIWPRFVMIPLTENSTIASLQAGGVIGLIGSVTIIAAATSARRSLRQRDLPVPVPAPGS